MNYRNNPDESYKSPESFEETIKVAKHFANLKGVLIDTDLLIIEIPSGVFIRTKISSMCDIFDGLYKAGYTKIGKNQWDKNTADVKKAINVFGDERLIKYKIGF